MRSGNLVTIWPKPIFLKDLETLSGKKLLFSNMATNFHISITQPSDSNQKIWPLYYVTPPNKLLCRPNTYIEEGKKRYSKNHFNASISKYESLKNQIFPSLYWSKKSTKIILFSTRLSNWLISTFCYRFV